MLDQPLAHVGDRGLRQSLETHLLNVSFATRARSEKIGLPTAGAVIGLVHDLGKASTAFRAYIESFLPDSERPRYDLHGTIDHATAGAQVLWRRLTNGKPEAAEAELARVLALCVASHHSGMIDCLGTDGRDLLQERINKAATNSHVDDAYNRIPTVVLQELDRLLADPALLKELRSKVHAVLHDGLAPRSVPPARAHLQLGLLVRLLFSCLIDADRTDTADAEDPRAASHRQHQQYVPWETLVQRLHASLSTLSTDKPIDALRRAVSEACFHAAERPAGCYTLTVPTGGGKTLAALRFALEHARRNHLDHVVFVSPFISVVDQNAEVARAALEHDGDSPSSVVLEHHSNLIDDHTGPGQGKAQSDRWRRKVLTENWDAPVVFTTMAQVLESLFGAGTRSVRRLHALARSVIVFDEAQTLPVKLVYLFNNAINLLTRHCGSTVLLCTATQPALPTVNAEFGAMRLADRPELVDAQTELFAALKRYTVRDLTEVPGGWTQEAVAELACSEALAHGSCLAVVNTKTHTRAVFEFCAALMPHARLAHLSTAMCPAHRKAVLDEIRAWLTNTPDEQKAQPILCISTQLIEAGVDIDFGAVIRDLAGLDSMAQAAGRCNRNGLREHGSVTLVQLPLPPKALEDIHLGRKAAQRILDDWRRLQPNESFPLHETKPMQDYFAQLFHDRREEMGYDVRPDKAGETETLFSLLGCNPAAARKAKQNGTPVKRVLLHQSFHTAGDAFELIAPTQGILVPFGEPGKEIINQIVATHDLEAEWLLLKQAQPYSVSVYTSELRKLERAGAVYRPESAPDLCVLQPGFYDNRFGLHDDADSLETLIG